MKRLIKERNMPNSDNVEIPYDDIVAETGMAILFKDDKEQFWIPKSVIEDHDEDDRIVYVAAWFAEKEGLV